MSNHLSHLLAKWHPNRDNYSWVLATIYDAKGPCYRKPGAMMLFSSQGEQLGMLSGGCLESDIAINARKVMQSGKSITVCYDGSDEDDLSFQLGIGCGGTLYIMLQCINKENDYLALSQVHEALKQQESGYLYQTIVANSFDERAYFEAEQITDIAASASIVNRAKENGVNQEKWLITPIVPQPHILVVGGGIDAQPLVNIAHQLGWLVSLWDPRPANARQEHFSKANYIIKGEAQVLTNFIEEKRVNAAILMSHNVAIDAQALKALATTNLQYLALLGPKNRREQVINQANINEQALPIAFAGPSGLDIGGTLPESIALSILSECHASLFGRNAQSLSQVL